MEVTTVLDGMAQDLTKEEILAVYNAAAAATYAGDCYVCKLYNLVDRERSTFGNLPASYLDIIGKAVETGNGRRVDLTADGTLPLSDVLSACMTQNDRLTEIELVLRGERLEFNDNGQNSVTGRMGLWLGDINGSLEQMGVTVTEGVENCSISVENLRIYCLIDRADNMIVKGEWSYDLFVTMKDCKVKFRNVGDPFSMQMTMCMRSCAQM